MNHLRTLPLNGSDRTGDKTTYRPAVAPVAPFPTEALPGPVGAYVVAAATAIGCDPSFIALPMLACLARAIGNKRIIRLKRTWTEPAIVWAAIIGKSGTHKTPALQAAMQFLQLREKLSLAAHADALAKHEQDLALYDRDFGEWRRSKSSDPPPWKPEPPRCNRMLTSDATIEALAALLANQDDGILVMRDELAGWINGIAEYKGGQGGDLSHWLASWSAAPMTVDRKTGAVRMLHIPRAAVSLVGGIQPGVLRSAIGREHMQDGLCARLLLAMPAPRPVRWTEATVDPAIEAKLGDVFDRFLSLEAAVDAEGNPEPYPLDLTPEAKAVWIDWYNRHREESADLGDDLAAAWSKLEAYAARLALIVQLSAWAAGDDAAAGAAVDEASMRAGIALADWFGLEAKRVYGLFGENDQERETRELVELILRKGGAITARELMRTSRQHQPAAVAEAALNALGQAGLGRWEVDVETGGRPRSLFRLLTPLTLTEASESPGLETFGNVNAVNGSLNHADGKGER
ncbi:YfjI family protein [Lacipirellula limnantheis]|uniref:DUF3987 domain-containing protein n=1 Tax=Lacipirellula limnantheis TaxID=2528024 RepID=A0A517U4L8_9BACT|nr:YfjI family protein [Lacipirellula limnantheis]QDT75577.1 hypothetical protein I41_47880 [Lacipirellula limnantheis]